MTVTEILRFPSSAIAPPKQPRLGNAADLIVDEEQWLVRPKGVSLAAGQRVIGTRWRASQPPPSMLVASTLEDCHVIGIPLRSTNLRLAIAGRAVLDGVIMPGTPLIVGPGIATDCVFRGPCDELHLHAPNELIAECADGIAGCNLEQLQRERAPAPDPVIERLGYALLGGGDGRVSQLYIDCISLAIIARLLDSTRRNPEPGKATPLPRWRLKRAMDYVESRLDETITLAELAASTGLTRMHFAAQFRAATGLRPHEYLLLRRVERAQEMLLGTDMPVVEIALSVGFQTQSHFTTVFKRFTGQPPLAWRQSQPRANIIPKLAAA
jgi:AraC family transcriptional regulator